MKKVVFLLVMFISGLIIISGCEIKKTEELTDAEKFANEYSVSEENPFKYIDIDEVLDIFENKSGIIYFGNSDCEWCISSAEILTEALVEEDIKEVYYYNPVTIKDKENEKYKKLLDILKEYLESDKDGNPELNMPDVYFVKNGKIIGHSNDTIKIDNEEDETITSKNKKELKNKYLKLISEYKKQECTDNC